MATSDSDDFESADEDVEDSKTLSVDRTTLNQGNATIARSDISSSSCSSTLTSSGGDAASPDTESDRLEAARDIGANENKTLNAAVEGLNISESENQEIGKRDPKARQQKTKQLKSVGVKKLGTKIVPISKVPEPETPQFPDNTDNSFKDTVENSRARETGDSCDALPLGKSTNSRVPDLDYERPPVASETAAEKKTSTSASQSDNACGKAGDGWGGWGGWGVSSLLSSASEGVASLTSQVSQGLSSVLEAGIGAPDPEELARARAEEARASRQTPLQQKQADGGVSEQPAEEGSTGLFGLGQIMSGVSSITRLVESTGSRVITGGLDTLETIGKKTMEVLQEGDPGLKKKRALFTDKTVLSQVLREAKERAEMEDRQRDELQQARKAHFETLFDDYQGLVHLEALEMLSKQCELKLQSTLLAESGPGLAALQRAHQEVKELCRLPEDDDSSEDADWQAVLTAAADHLGVPFATAKIIKTWGEAAEWLAGSGDQGRGRGAREVHRKAMESLARLTAESVEQFHKVAELLLVKEAREPSQEALMFVQITSAVTLALNSIAAQFSEHLNKCPASPSSPDEANNFITNIFFEANNSGSYVEEALRLMVPVLQAGLHK